MLGNTHCFESVVSSHSRTIASHENCNALQDCRVNVLHLTWSPKVNDFEVKNLAQPNPGETRGVVERAMGGLQGILRSSVCGGYSVKMTKAEERWVQSRGLALFGAEILSLFLFDLRAVLLLFI